MNESMGFAIGPHGIHHEASCDVGRAMVCTMEHAMKCTMLLTTHGMHHVRTLFCLVARGMCHVIHRGEYGAIHHRTRHGSSKTVAHATESYDGALKLLSYGTCHDIVYRVRHGAKSWDAKYCQLPMKYTMGCTMGYPMHSTMDPHGLLHGTCCPVGRAP